jgi:hypothetical protein
MNIRGEVGATHEISVFFEPMIASFTLWRDIEGGSDSDWRSRKSFSQMEEFFWHRELMEREFAE